MEPNVSQLYSTSELREIGVRYLPNLRRIWAEDFLPHLSPDERAQAGTVNLNLPLVGATGYPLEFYSYPIQRQVFLPIASLKFIDDLAVAYAYYDKMGCDLGTISDYAAVLRFRPQHVMGSPLDTLGVPRTAINDPYVNDVAQKVLKSIVFFVAVHEFAHVMHHHKDYKEFEDAQQAQRQESEADALAVEVMRRIGVPPVGLTFFFLIASRMEISPGDFDTLAEYELHLRKRATHPLSTQRLLNVAENIENNVSAFARLQADPASWEQRLKAAALSLREIARTLDDRKMRLFLAERAQRADVAAFRLACRR